MGLRELSSAWLDPHVWLLGQPWRWMVSCKDSGEQHIELESSFSCLVHACKPAYMHKYLPQLSRQVWAIVVCLGSHSCHLQLGCAACCQQTTWLVVCLMSLHGSGCGHAIVLLVVAWWGDVWLLTWLSPAEELAESGTGRMYYSGIMACTFGGIFAKKVFVKALSTHFWQCSVQDKRHLAND
eukprot:GHUV01014361.1.p1 GENE.GHUV01014361.1~~GHUV01014361.1.p1  ORF type:complete len:182 (+),score=14.67 GHUV01014361.1:2720-3265(+)